MDFMEIFFSVFHVKTLKIMWNVQKRGIDQMSG